MQLARVLAQIWASDDAENQRVPLLDEPVTGLDVHYQIHILDSAKAMLASDCTLIAVLHDLNLAFDYADAVFIIDSGSLVLKTADAHGGPASVLENVFDVSAEQTAVPDDGLPIWRFSRRSASAQ